MASVVSSDRVREISFVGANDCKRILAVGVSFLKIYTITAAANKRELKSTFSLTCRLDIRLHSWLNAKECVCWCEDDDNKRSHQLVMIDFKSNAIKPISVDINTNITQTDSIVDSGE